MKHYSFDVAQIAAKPVPIYRGGYKENWKRIFDVMFVITLTPFLLPVVLLLAVLTKLDGGPAFFGHLRVGRNGRHFRCWKMRTMVVGAEEKLKTYLSENPEAAAEWARNEKLSHDPRITRVGRIMRKTSLDELPQFWNVFFGEMSVVGPRPYTPAQAPMYAAYTQKISYHQMRPGVTGLWQVYRRPNTRFLDRVRYDELYWRNMSFWGDIALIGKTLGAVVNATGR